MMDSDIEEYLKQLTAEFKRAGDSSTAKQQKAYMKGQFEYFGMKTPVRREATKPFLQKDYLPSKNELALLLKTVWERPERDFQMFGLDLMAKYKNKLSKEDIGLLEYLITNKSWWDSVDFIASTMVGAYFIKFPNEIQSVIPRWMKSESMWLKRTCIIFQLKYRDKVDLKLLSTVIIKCLGSKEFFINKAIGWALREVSKTNAEWVIDFANKYELSGLSRREALRLIK